MKHEYNHPTQGLEEMTLDLSGYSAEALSELAERIENEKKKRDVKVPFVVVYYDEDDEETGSLTIYKGGHKTLVSLYHRLSAEAKLRAAGGGGVNIGKIHYLVKGSIDGEVIALPTTILTQGVIYFDSEDKALDAYATLTPEERQAIFEFGEG